MQNLPIIATQPAPSIQPPASTDNSNAAPPAESFNSVLARQRSNASSPDTSSQGGKPSASAASATSSAAPASAKDGASATNTETPATTPAATSSATIPETATGALPGDILATLPPPPVPTSNTLTGNNTLAGSNTPTGNNTLAGNKKEITTPQPSAPEVASTLSGGMLATLPASPVATSGTLANDNTPSGRKKEKTAPQSAGPDATSTLPSDMLAMMLPATAAATSGKSTPAPLSAASKPPQALSIAAPLPGETLQVAGSQGTAAATTAGQAKDHAFSAILDTLAKDGINAAPPDGGTAAAHVASSTPDSLLQSGAAAISAANSGNAPMQTGQAVINTPLAHDAWGNEFSQKIIWMASRHEQTAELHLNPPNLGPLNVVLKVSGDQATALFTSPHAAVRDAVTQAMPQLRDMLANNGITLGNTTVNDQAPKDQQAWQASQQQQGSGSASKAAAAATDSITPSTAVSLVRSHQGMVDTFA